MSTVIRLIPMDSPLCTVSHSRIYTVFHLVFYPKKWYFIVRKGDTNVQVKLKGPYQNKLGQTVFAKIPIL